MPLIRKALRRSGMGGGGGSGDTSGLTVHMNQHYIAAHGHLNPPNRVYHGSKWGIIGGTGRDESDRIIQALADIESWGGNAVLEIHAANPNDNVMIVSKPISIYASNVHFKSGPDTRWSFGAKGGVRGMGRYGEYTPKPDGFALKLRANTEENDDGRLVIKAQTGEGVYYTVGQKLTIRGRNDASGKAIEKQTTYVYSVDGDDITCVDSADFTFQPTYDDSDWGPDATTGTTIYFVYGGLMTTDHARGSMEIEIDSITGLAVGDMVEISTDETEWDVNNGAISGTPAYPNGRKYRNPARREYAKIVAISGSGPYTVRINRALSHNYTTARYGGVFKVAPVVNVHISGLRCEYYEDQINRSVHPLSIVYGENCHVYDCEVDGSGGQRGQGCRIAYSYNCHVYNSVFKNPKWVASGDGYGPSLYYCTGCSVHDNRITGCRHSVLLQLATACLIYSNFSFDDYISAYDAHGVNSHDCIFYGNYVSRSKNNSPDSSDCGAFRIGNTSHVVGDHYITVANNFIDGYMHTNSAALEVLASSSNVTFIGNVVNGCQIGFKFKRNPSWITPVQTAVNIQVIGNRLSKCASKTIEVICDPDFDATNSSGMIDGLLIKDNISDGNNYHFEVEGRLGLTNLRIVGNEIWNPVDNAGRYAIDVDQCLGTIEVAYNICCGANRGIRIQDTENAVVAHNILSGTTEDTPITASGTTTGLVAQLNVPFTGGGGGGDISAEFTAKGQLLAGTGTNTYTTLSVGTNGYFLKANSAQSTGMEWSNTLPTLNLTTAATNVNGLIIDMITSATVDAWLVKYNSTNRIRAQATATDSFVAINGFDNGSSYGGYLYIGRNNNASTPAAGFLQMSSRGGTNYSLWVDSSGNLRIGTAPPTNATDASGTIVGGGGGSITWPQKIADSGSTSDPASGTAGALVYYNNVGAYDVDTGADGVFVTRIKSASSTLRDYRIEARNYAVYNAGGIVFRTNSAGELAMGSSTNAIRTAIVKDRGTSGLKLWAGSVDAGIEIESNASVTVHGSTTFESNILAEGIVSIGTTYTSSLGANDHLQIGGNSPGISIHRTSGEPDPELLLRADSSGCWMGSNGNDPLYISAYGKNQLEFLSYASIINDEVRIIPPNTTTGGIQVRMPASTTSDAFGILYNLSTRFRVTVNASNNGFVLEAFNNGTGLGSLVRILNNNNGSTPAAGHLRIANMGGTEYRIWPDQNGLLRIWTGNPTNSDDMSGTVVGTQSSHAKYKRIIGPPVNGKQALAHVVAAAQQVLEFEYLDGRFNRQRFSGIVLDGPTLNRYGMDADAEHPAGKSLNEVTAIGDLMLAVAELKRELDEMKARLN